MAYLELISGRAFGRVYPLDRLRLRLGRNSDVCDLSEPFLGDRNVSRTHAEIRLQGEHYFLSDLGSSNGTWLNGEKLVGPGKLDDGDRIRICAYEFRLHTLDTCTQPAPEITPATHETCFLDQEADNSRVEMTAEAPVPVTPTQSTRITNPEEKLRATLEMLSGIGSALRLEDVTGNLLEGLLNVFPQADRAVIRLVQEEDGVLPSASGTIEAVKHRHPERAGPVPISQKIMESVTCTKRAILSSYLESDPRFRGSESVRTMGMRSVMCAPLLDTESNVMGIIQTDAARKDGRFVPEDLDLLTSILPQVAAAVRHAQLYGRQVEQDRIHRDLELARRVQQELLPRQEPAIDRYSFFSFYRPAIDLGGDYFDYVPLADGRLAIVVASVAGKGIAAALLAAKLSRELKHFLAGEASPTTVTDRLNRSLCESSPTLGNTAEHSVTQALLILDPASHTVAIANAGHGAPLLRRSDGKVEAAGEQATGPPLGVNPDETYRQANLTLGLGDSLTIFTDGFIEAQRGDGQQYGLKRMTSALRQGGDTPSHIGQSILEDVDRFAGGQAQNDDQCLVCFQRSAKAWQ